MTELLKISCPCITWGRWRKKCLHRENGACTDGFGGSLFKISGYGLIAVIERIGEPVTGFFTREIREIGSIAEKGDAFIRGTKERTDVAIIEVTLEDHDILIEKVLDEIKRS